jgi:hypothetical protein
MSQEDTTTPEFKAWFGESKVVDAQGKPLVMYHGTTADFNEFKLQSGRIWFAADPSYTNPYAGENARARGEFKVGGNVMPLMVAMKNPLRFEASDVGRQGWARVQDEQAIADGHDGVLFVGPDGDIKAGYALLPEQIKSAIGNRGTFNPNDPSILNQSATTFTQSQTEAFKAWSNNAPLVNAESAESHQFKTGEKVAVEAFHGTARPDRVGVKFLKKRATSGPMSYFTSDPTVGSNYATGKQDTSLSNEDQGYENWFKIKFKGDRSTTDIVRAWWRLTPEQKTTVSELAPRVMYSEEQETDGGNKIILGPEGHKSGTGSYDYNLAETQRGFDKRGNPLKALVEDWLNSGNLFNDEERFLQVLKLAGFPVETVDYDPPTATYPFVYKVFLAMSNPLVTSDVPPSVGQALNAAAKRDRSRAKVGADMWAKDSRTLREWVAEFNKEDNQYVWTSIPDKVTEVFRSLGYDGIIDVGGKGGGQAHRVYIPFDETQVKSAIGNKGKFSADTNNILNQTWYSALQRQVESTKTTSAPAKGWKDLITGLINKGLVKRDEVEAVGLPEWLDLQGKVTKEQLLDFVRANGVRVEETVLGGAGAMPKELADYAHDHFGDDIPTTAQEWLDQSASHERTAQSWQKNGDTRQAQRHFRLAEQMNQMAEQLETDSGKVAGATKFSSWQLPGGTNYQERLFRIIAPKVEPYTDQHWDTPTDIWVRTNDRVDVEGKRVLFIEEFQSGRAQKGKKEGFAPKDRIGEAKRLLEADGKKAEFNGVNWIVTTKDGKDLKGIWGDKLFAGDLGQAAGMALGRRDLFPSSGSVGSVPPAPFVTTTDKWVALAMKRVIKLAVDEGYDAVAFINGQQSTDRYWSHPVVEGAVGRWNEVTKHSRTWRGCLGPTDGGVGVAGYCGRRCGDRAQARSGS